MSENELDDERGEAYLEIQMDRSTIVLAALALLALLAGAFLLGSWFGSRGRGETPETGGPTAEEAAAHAEHDSEDVAAEQGFGGRAVSAEGAPPVGAVPPARATAAPPPGPAGSPTEEVVTSSSAPSAATVAKASAPARATTAKAAKATAPAKASAPAKATAPAKASAPAKATAAAPKASSTPAAAGWVIQVSAAKDRADAERLASKLRGKGYPVRLVEEAPYIKVHVGPYVDRAEAEAAERRLKRDEKLPTWLKRG